MLRGDCADAGLRSCCRPLETSDLDLERASLAWKTADNS